jgi:hypothetical protein
MCASHEISMARVRGRLLDGTLIDGVEALRQPCGAIGRVPVVALTRLPGEARAPDAAYDRFARRRPRLRRRCDERTCGP